MRKSGERAVLIHVGLLALNKQHSLCTYLNQTHHLHAGDRAGTPRRGFDMHHLQLAYLAGRSHPCSSEAVTEH